MKIQILYHVSFEGPGYIYEWAKSRGHAWNETRLFAGDPLPQPEDFDLLVVMGGPMGVYDEHICPWLADEKDLIKKAIRKGKAVLGICLGSQLIAHTLGSRVYRNKYKEIGWFDIRFTNHFTRHPLKFPDRLGTFHWHGDTFDLPEKAVLLASSEATVNQAFIFDKAIIGVQFHPEIMPEDLQRMINGAGNELKKDIYVQTAQELLQKGGNYKENHEILVEILQYIEAQVHAKKS